MAHVFSFDVDRLRNYATKVWNGEAIVPRFSSDAAPDDFVDDMVMIAGACLKMAYVRYETGAMESGRDLDSEAVFQLMIDLNAGALFCGGITDPDEPYGKTPLVEVHCEEFRCSPPEHA